MEIITLGSASVSSSFSHIKQFWTFDHVMTSRAFGEESAWQQRLKIVGFEKLFRAKYDLQPKGKKTGVAFIALSRANPPFLKNKLSV